MRDYFHLIKLYRLVTPLTEKMRQLPGRKGFARSNIYLAFKNPSTALRQEIVDTAIRLVEEHEEKLKSQAAELQPA